MSIVHVDGGLIKVDDGDWYVFVLAVLRLVTIRSQAGTHLLIGLTVVQTMSKECVESSSDIVVVIIINRNAEVVLMGIWTHHRNSNNNFSNDSK